ncbi:actinorhodin polyketide synthase acyl carrier protein [Longimycelium tulufanense]|uniref:Actinorhodin polyketide synthase acyl carrier protein n=1 Tax=Longimycelium tulufanense TaxID=907463 RepID=A0A8J3CBZ2_9PSEU|nr:acyl carrier protein [Longimycelium tulufanense]GGM71820.1 actinorhodin polyketide synthase acyl carrier protein [Longimycelium tulufanense]
MLAEKFTLSDLIEIMRARAGVAEGVRLDTAIGDTSFLELGYDSLAVLEIQARIAERVGVSMPDDAVSRMPTPNAAVEFVNQQLAQGR